MNAEFVKRKTCSTIGVLLLSLVFSFTLGSFGSGGRPFLADLGQASGTAIWSALLGGIVFSLSNILLVAAIDIAGMAVAFPIGVGLALVLGVIINYVKLPVGDPTYLTGVLPRVHLTRRTAKRGLSYVTSQRIGYPQSPHQ